MAITAVARHAPPPAPARPPPAPVRPAPPPPPPVQNQPAAQPVVQRPLQRSETDIAAAVGTRVDTRV